MLCRLMLLLQSVFFFLVAATGAANSAQINYAGLIVVVFLAAGAVAFALAVKGPPNHD